MVSFFNCRRVSGWTNSWKVASEAERSSFLAESNIMQRLKICESEGIYPISLSIPAEFIVSEDHVDLASFSSRTLLSEISPVGYGKMMGDAKRWTFSPTKEGETEYHSTYSKSLFALTMKKAGTVPIFVGIEDAPPGVLSLVPRDLFVRARKLTLWNDQSNSGSLPILDFSGNDQNSETQKYTSEYLNLRKDFLKVARQKLTTLFSAQRLLSIMGFDINNESKNKKVCADKPRINESKNKKFCADKPRILFLTGRVQDQNYIRELILLDGESSQDKINQNSSESHTNNSVHVTDFPKLSFMYAELNSNDDSRSSDKSYEYETIHLNKTRVKRQSLYGWGFTYSHLLPDLTVNRSPRTIEKNIRNMEYDLVIYSRMDGMSYNPLSLRMSDGTLWRDDNKGEKAADVMGYPEDVGEKPSWEYPPFWPLVRQYYADPFPKGEKKVAFLFGSDLYELDDAMKMATRWSQFGTVFFRELVDCPEEVLQRFEK